MTGNGPVLAIDVPADDAAPAAAIAAVRRFAAKAGLDTADAARLAIVIEELVCNAVEHGAPLAGSRIELVLAAIPGGVRMTLADAGAPFNPGTASPDAVVPERGGGAGLAIVLRWTRIEHYERIGGVNRLTLVLSTG